MTRSADLGALALPAQQERLPMFGHRTVSLGQHIGGVFGSAVIASTVWALLIVGLSVLSPAVLLRLGEGGAVFSIFMLACTVWLAVLLLVLPVIGLTFTLMRLLLSRCRLNFGWAYALLGSLACLIAARGLDNIAQGRGYSLAELLAFCLTGFLAGVGYWFVICRNPNSEPLATASNETTMPGHEPTLL